MKDLLAFLVLLVVVLVIIAVETVRSVAEVIGRRWLVLIAISMVALILLSLRLALGRDLGQWEHTDPKIHEWYQHLTRPDVPSMICCTEADAYWADEFYFRDGKMYVRITDDRDDLPLGRPHIANGTEIEVPPEKLKHDDGNPTGHGVLFVSTSGFTWCYVQPGGV